MIKKVIGFLFLVVFSFVSLATVFAQGEVANTITSTSSTSDKIACVKTAVLVREASIIVAYNTYTNAVNAAYATRTNELTGAYSNKTVKEVQAGVKVSWADFNKTTKAANKTWTTNRNTAWSTFKTATKACKSPSGVSDFGNSGLEVK